MMEKWKTLAKDLGCHLQKSFDPEIAEWSRLVAMKIEYYKDTRIALIEAEPWGQGFKKSEWKNRVVMSYWR